MQWKQGLLITGKKKQKIKVEVNDVFVIRGR